jgi:hypothetical protein
MRKPDLKLLLPCVPDCVAHDDGQRTRASCIGDTTGSVLCRGTQCAGSCRGHPAAVQQAAAATRHQTVLTLLRSQHRQGHAGSSGTQAQQPAAAGQASLPAVASTLEPPSTVPLATQRLLAAAAPRCTTAACTARHYQACTWPRGPGAWSTHTEARAHEWPGRHYTTATADRHARS